MHDNDWFRVNDKQIIKMSKIGEIVKSKNYTRKINSPFLIYDDFESVLVPENNGKQISDECYMNKYQNYVAVVLIINWCVLLINLPRLLSHIYIKILFISLSLISYIRFSFDSF